MAQESRISKIRREVTTICRYLTVECAPAGQQIYANFPKFDELLSAGVDLSAGTSTTDRWVHIVSEGSDGFIRYMGPGRGTCMDRTELPPNVNPELVYEIRSNADDQPLQERLKALSLEFTTDNTLRNHADSKIVLDMITNVEKCFDPRHNIALWHELRVYIKDLISKKCTPQELIFYLQEWQTWIEQRHASFAEDGFITAVFIVFVRICIALEQFRLDTGLEDGRFLFRMFVTQAFALDVPDTDSMVLQYIWLRAFIIRLAAVAYSIFHKSAPLAAVARDLEKNGNLAHKLAMEEDIESFYATLHFAYPYYKAAWLINMAIVKLAEEGPLQDAVRRELPDIAKRFKNERLNAEENYVRITDSLLNAIRNINNEVLQDQIEELKNKVALCEEVVKGTLSGALLQQGYEGHQKEIALARITAKVCDEVVEKQMAEYIDNQWLYPKQYRELFLSKVK